MTAANASYSVVLQTSWLRQRLAGSAATRTTLTFPAGVSRTPERLELLATPGAQTIGDGTAPCVFVACSSEPDRLRPRLAELQATRPTASVAAAVILGVGAAAGRLTGASWDGEKWQSLARVTFVGPGWRIVSLDGSDHALTGPNLPVVYGDRLLAAESFWSRSIGALGRDAFERLTSRRFAIVGCGRTGSLVAAALSRIGVAALDLIDFDRIEPHNLGEMVGVKLDDLDRPKVDAVRDGCVAAGLRVDQRVHVHRAAASSLAALAPLKAADALICAVDSPSARLYTACLAAFYCKPLLDVGTAVFNAPATPAGSPGLAASAERLEPAFGADVRLTLGDHCLFDLGGVEGWPPPAQRGPPPDRRVATPRDRAGSLRSLNGAAVDLGLWLLEDLARGAAHLSIWLRLESGSDGLPALTRPYAAPRRDCPLCRLAGRGDAALALLPDLWRTLAARSQV